MASGDYPAARARFDTLAKSPLRSHQMAAKVATGKVLLAQDKADEALASFDEVAAMTPSTPSEIATRFDALVGKAQCQRKQGALQEAVVTLNEILDKTTADESDLRARAYLLIGDCYRDQQQPKKAVMAYLHVDLLYDREKAAHAESLYQLAQVWPAAGHPERGAEAASRLRQLYPNNGWTKKLGGA